MPRSRLRLPQTTGWVCRPALVRLPRRPGRREQGSAGGLRARQGIQGVSRREAEGRPAPCPLPPAVTNRCVHARCMCTLVCFPLIMYTRVWERVDEKEDIGVLLITLCRKLQQ